MPKLAVGVMTMGMAAKLWHGCLPGLLVPLKVLYYDSLCAEKQCQLLGSHGCHANVGSHFQ